jgi:hypothetical protein
MRIERNAESIDVFVRQSWLNEYRECPERARWAMLNDSTSTDLTVIGTSVHAAAEAWIRDNALTVSDLEEVASTVMQSTVVDRWTKYDMDGAVREARLLARAWHRDLRSHATDVVHAEWEFKVPFAQAEFNDTPVTVWLTGTADLVKRDSLWDWKTSRTKYSWRDKQLSNIQSSVYAYAAKYEGLLEYPIKFHFGVLLRGSGDTQVVQVTRDSAHEEWLRHQVLVAVRHTLAMGDNQSWPTNDQSGLCSPDWCGAWATCKGAHLPHIPYPTRSK